MELRLEASFLFDNEFTRRQNRKQPNFATPFAMIQSQQQFEALVNSIDGIVWEADGETFRFIFVSQQAERILGYPVEKWFKPTFWVDHLHPDDREWAIGFCIEATECRRDHQFEYRMIAADGRQVWLRDLVTVHVQPDGSVRLRGVIFDVTERKQADDDLRAQKEILQKIVDHIPVMINFTDGAGRINLVNQEWQQTLGWTLEEIEAEGFDIFAECYPDVDARQEVMKFIESATGDWIDFKTRTRDGSFIDTTWARIRLSDDTTIGIGRDVTEQRRADRSLRLFRTLIDHSTDGIFIFDPKTPGFLDCNRSAHEYLGYSREEFLSLSIFDIDPVADEPFLARVVEELNRSGSTRFESIHQRKDGSTFPVEVSLKTVSLDKDYRLAMVRDITERKQAEKALRKSEDRLRLAIDTIPTMAWSLQADGTVDFVNKRWMDYTGLSLAEEIGAPTRVIHPEDIQRTVQNWLVAMTAGEAAEEELRLRRADGEYRWFLVRTAPLQDEQGNAVKWYGVATDIEDRKLAEDRLRETTEQLRALSASLQSAREEEGRRISRELHDELGSALTSLKWDIENFDKVISESPDQEQLQDLKIKIDDMLKLAESTISSVRRISAELRPAVLDDLGPIEAIEWQAEQFQSRTGITCRIHRSSNEVNLNREQSTAVFRIFQEALTNILRHARAKQVEISLQQRLGEFILSISDDGQGMRDSETSGSRSLGLIGMRERAHLIGGKIDIKGNEGCGTNVILRIPMPASNGEHQVIKFGDASDNVGQ